MKAKGTKAQELTTPFLQLCSCCIFLPHAMRDTTSQPARHQFCLPPYPTISISLICPSLPQAGAPHHPSFLD